MIRTEAPNAYRTATGTVEERRRARTRRPKRPLKSEVSRVTNIYGLGLSRAALNKEINYLFIRLCLIECDVRRDTNCDTYCSCYMKYMLDDTRPSRMPTSDACPMRLYEYVLGVAVGSWQRSVAVANEQCECAYIDQYFRNYYTASAITYGMSTAILVKW